MPEPYYPTPSEIINAVRACIGFGPLPGTELTPRARFADVLFGSGNRQVRGHRFPSFVSDQLDDPCEPGGTWL